MTDVTSSKMLANCPFCGSPAREQENWRNHYGCSDPNCGAYHAALSREQWNARPVQTTGDSREALSADLEKVQTELDAMALRHERLRAGLLEAVKLLDEDAPRAVKARLCTLAGHDCEFAQHGHETSPSQDTADAANWRALMNCGRISVVGSAGLGDGKEAEPYGHLTLNFWTGLPDGSGIDPLARIWLHRFMEKARRHQLEKGQC